MRWLKALSMNSADLLCASGSLPFLAVMLKTLIWARPEVRAELQRNGVNVTPANFYSNIPSVEEIRNSFEFENSEVPPYQDSSIFDASHMLKVLEELLPYASEFDPPTAGSEEEPKGYFWGNSQFSYSDAMAYYAMIRHIKPRRILEVGSGFSTLVASAALARNGGGEIVCVEPFPRPFLDSIPGVVQVVQKPVQQLDSEFFNQNLGAGDILFIDSTHTVKVGSDCVHLYLRILPALNHEVMVHVHDIFLPQAMPQEWSLDKHIYWTEQYLLMAYLLDNNRAKVWFGSNYHRLMNRERLAEMMYGRAVAGGGSFWFQMSGREFRSFVD
ncbi:MAG: class I SAM-dependent methyltransferase [Nitrosomonadales bacterium]|nr:class I SAM-dependent methyltransferase [Nitrosomonadales bacterium]